MNWQYRFGQPRKERSSRGIEHHVPSTRQPQATKLRPCAIEHTPLSDVRMLSPSSTARTSRARLRRTQTAAKKPISRAEPCRVSCPCARLCSRAPLASGYSTLARSRSSSARSVSSKSRLGLRGPAGGSEGAFACRFGGRRSLWVLAFPCMRG